MSASNRGSDPIQGTFSLSVWTRYRACCVCGDPGSNAHHVLFKGQGGEDVIANGVMLCGSGTTGHHGRMHAMDEDTRRAIGFHIVRDRPDTVEYILGKLGAEQGRDYFRRVYFMEVPMTTAPQPGKVDAARVIAYEDDSGEYRWTAFDTNNEEVANSGDDGYVDRDYAEKAARDLFPNAVFEWESEV